MAIKKISAMVELTAPAVGDLLVITDISEALDVNKTKKITFANLVNVAAQVASLSTLTSVVSTDLLIAVRAGVAYQIAQSNAVPNIVTAKIVDLNVTTAKIADTAITTAKLAYAVVIPEKVATKLSKTYRSTPQSIPNGAWTAISWDGVLSDSEGHYSGAQPTRLTVPYNGYYMFGANIAFDPNGVGIRQLSVRVYGSVTAGCSASMVAAPSIDSQLAASTVVYLAAGDYIWTTVYQNSGGALSTNDYYAGHMWLHHLGS